MPSWTSHRLLINGPHQQVESLVSAFDVLDDEGNHRIDFEVHVPIPDEIKAESDPDTLSDSEDQWLMLNWGTTWSNADARIERPLKSVAVCHFSTAGSPPLPWLMRVAKQFPELLFELRWDNEGGDPVERTLRVQIKTDVWVVGYCLYVAVDGPPIHAKLTALNKAVRALKLADVDWSELSWMTYGSDIDDEAVKLLEDAAHSDDTALGDPAIKDALSVVSDQLLKDLQLLTRALQHDQPVPIRRGRRPDISHLIGATSVPDWRKTSIDLGLGIQRLRVCGILGAASIDT